MKKIARLTQLVKSIVPDAKDVEDHVTKQHVSREVQGIMKPSTLQSIAKDIDAGNSKGAVEKLGDLNEALERLEKRIVTKPKKR